MATFEFQELTPRDTLGRPILGIMLYGEAELVGSDPENNPDQFYVASVTLDGGFTLDPRSEFDGVLFKKIAAELENGKTELGRLAQAVFSEAVEAGASEIPFRQRMLRELERTA